MRERCLDYYLLDPDRLVVEEFLRAGDGSAQGLCGATWTPAQGRWDGGVEFSLAMRADAALRARVTAIDRDHAETEYRRLGGGDLPAETILRTYFTDQAELRTAPILRLHDDPVPDGYRERRLYRLLFAGDLGPDALATLRSRWRMTVGDPTGRVAGTATLDLPRDRFSWDLRRLGGSIAWCVDVTALLGESPDVLGRLLKELSTAVRGQGLIPVTVERFV